MYRSKLHERYHFHEPPERSEKRWIEIDDCNSWGGDADINNITAAIGMTCEVFWGVGLYGGYLRDPNIFMLVDCDGDKKHLPVNKLASLLYGGRENNWRIYGKALLVKVDGRFNMMPLTREEEDEILGVLRRIKIKPWVDDEEYIEWESTLISANREVQDA